MRKRNANEKIRLSFSKGVLHLTHSAVCPALGLFFLGERIFRFPSETAGADVASFKNKML